MKKQYLLYHPYWLVVFMLYALCLSCANIVSPTGGPRDIKGPLVVRRSMPDSSLNFKGGSIHFDFDEFIQLKDVQNQFIITPFLKTNPKVTAHKKQLTIQLPDSLLEKNTTYNVSFGNAVQDIHEGNIFQGLDFTFSTGAFIDSLSLQGRIIDAATGKPDTTCYAMLYAEGLPDSAFHRQKPLYAQKALGGSFLFKNLPDRSFTLYALQDLNKSFKYDAQGERIAFLEKNVRSTDSGAVTLYTFLEQDKPDTTSKRKSFQLKPAIAPTKAGNKLTYTVNIDTSSKTKRNMDMNDSLALKFDRPLKQFDETKLRIFQEEILDASAQLQLDSTKRTIYLNTQWAEDALYKVVLQKGFAQDSAGLQSPADQFYFRTKRKSDYGFLTVLCKKEEQNMIELLKNNVVVASKKALDTLISFPLLLPDNYEIRILNDANQNGHWDSGVFFGKKRLPEIVTSFPGTVAIKANWENKMDLRITSARKPKQKK